MMHSNHCYMLVDTNDKPWGIGFTLTQAKRDASDYLRICSHEPITPELALKKISKKLQRRFLYVRQYSLTQVKNVEMGK